jgi:signal transduction histidine kinase/CheY-like chemotaxis protein/HAMP domain-containing protein
MNLSFRSKLVALVATATLALTALVLVSSIIGRRVGGHLEEIRRNYLPKVGLRPRLEAQFERIQRAFQDAVAAKDPEKAAATTELKKQLLQQIADSSGAVDPALASALAQAVEDFHGTGLSLSRRLIGGETGEGVVAQMGDLQTEQKRVAVLLDKATAFDEAELTRAFTAADDAQRTGSRVGLAVSAACLAVVFLLFFWISRDLLRSLTHLTAGFRRFGEGDFAVPIPIVSSDELGDLARQANHMSQSLMRLEADRRGADWLTTGRAGLAEQLRGEMEPKEAADRAVTFLCSYLGCVVGALHAAGADGVFRVIGQHALAAAEPIASFRPGEGLAGEAVLRPEITVVRSPLEQLRIRSGLVEGTPHSVALVPLLRAGKVTGLLELASLWPWESQATELLMSVRETLAIALEVSRGRAELRALLDETERHRGALEEKNTALIDIRGRLELQADELTKASAYKSQFLANMSHELRTPLNGIIGFAQLLHDEEAGPLLEQQKDFLRDVLRSGRHLLQLINDVLDLSKVEAGKLEFRPERIDLGKLVGEVLAVLRTASQRVRVESAIDPAVQEVIVDPGRLKQVLYNYVSNALKFTPEGGTVSIRLTAEGSEKFRLEVEDTGKGIAEADLARLFVEFQQVHDGAAKGQGGTGLGLALTRRLIEAQGGSVGARSTVGKGSTFFAVLPRKAGDAVPAPETRVRVSGTGGPTVLVIEDIKGDQDTLADVLSRAGYLVHAAATGAAALELIGARAFDAVTLDLFLPDMTGLELLTQLRAGGLNKKVPVVVVTVVTERGAVAGFDVHDVLSKPIDPAALLATLIRAGVAPHRPGTVLVVDDDPGSLKLVSATLKQLGYETRGEPDGAAGLRAFRERPPTAVILDLMMPGMDGFEFLERVRREPGGQGVPVIVWTVKDLTPEERTFLRSSAQAVVSKGQGGAAVLAELETLMGRKPAA